MLEDPVLSAEQIADFERDGYLVIRGAFGAKTTATSPGRDHYLRSAAG